MLVCVVSMARELWYMDDIWIRYVTLPELSVEGFQANVALVRVIAVVCRLVGVVGALRSFAGCVAARAGDGLSSRESTIKASSVRTVPLKRYHLFMFFLLKLLDLELLNL